VTSYLHLSLEAADISAIYSCRFIILCILALFLFQEICFGSYSLSPLRFIQVLILVFSLLVINWIKIKVKYDTLNYYLSFHTLCASKLSHKLIVTEVNGP
jgi:hypothetical protein